jgi:predicted nucleotidyltransferase
MIPDFTDKGYLPEGYHKTTLNEFKDRFSKNKSQKRQEIIKEYEKHLKEILNTNLVTAHWINGSFVTDKKEPEDIDILTEFDSVKTDNLDMKAQIDYIIFNAQRKYHNLCDSHRIFKYPESMKKEYKTYISVKTKYLCLLFNSDREYNLKGVINLSLEKK